MTRKYRAEQDIHISGWECGTEIEIKMVVTFAVTPEEPQTSIHPGAPRMLEDVEPRFFRENGDEISLPAWIVDRFTDRPSFKSYLLESAANDDEAAFIDAEEMKAEAKRDREWEDRL